MKQETKQRLARAFGPVAIMAVGFSCAAFWDLMTNGDFYAFQVKLDRERQAAAAVANSASAPVLGK